MSLVITERRLLLARRQWRNALLDDNGSAAALYLARLGVMHRPLTSRKRDAIIALATDATIARAPEVSGSVLSLLPEDRWPTHVVDQLITAELEATTRCADMVLAGHQKHLAARPTVAAVHLRAAKDAFWNLRLDLASLWSAAGKQVARTYGASEDVRRALAQLCRRVDLYLYLGEDAWAHGEPDS